MNRLEKLDPLALEAEGDYYHLVLWLMNSGTYYDSTETGGVAATRLLVEDRNRRGFWVFPLDREINLDTSGIAFWEANSPSNNTGPNVKAIETPEGIVLEASITWDSPCKEPKSAYTRLIELDKATFIPTMVKVISPILNDVEVSSVEDYR